MQSWDLSLGSQGWRSGQQHIVGGQRSRVEGVETGSGSEVHAVRGAPVSYDNDPRKSASVLDTGAFRVYEIAAFALGRHAYARSQNGGVGFESQG